MRTTGAYLSRFERCDERLLVNQSAPGRVHNDDSVLHLLELRRADDVSRGLVQGEVQAENVGAGQQLVKGHIRRVAFQLGWKTGAVVVLDLHAERSGPTSHFLCLSALPVPHLGPNASYSSNPSHSENSQSLSVGVVAQLRLSLPLTCICVVSD